MNVGCRYKIGDVIKGLKIVSQPYKCQGKKAYRAMVECSFCGKRYDTVLSEIHRHVFDGCGCKKNRSNSKKWKSFDSWCRENNCEYLLDLWDYDLNVKSPSDISCQTEDVYYFKCPDGKHLSSAHRILNFAVPSKSKKKTCIYCNSFAQHLINEFGNDALNKYWDYEKNNLDPWKIQYKSLNSIWIKCTKTDYHGSFDTCPQVFFATSGKCPYCYHRRINKKDSFAYYYIKNMGKIF